MCVFVCVCLHAHVCVCVFVCVCVCVCVYVLNGSEFRQKLIVTIIRVLVRHIRPASNNDKDPFEVKCNIRAQCVPPPLPTYIL